MVERETSGENTTESERNRFPVKAGIGVRFSVDTPSLYEEWNSENEEQFQKTIKAFDMWILENIKTAYPKEKPEDLTEDEKFSLAYHAGVKANWFMVDGKFQGQTEPCGIIKPDGKWVVMFGNGEGRVLN